MRYRRFLAAVLAVAVTMGLSGCGRQRDESDLRGLETVNPSNQRVVFWYQHSGEREAALLELIERFNQINPHGITVLGEYIGSHDAVYHRMLLRMQSGPLPQLVVAYRYQAQAYYRNNAVVDLTPYINSPRWGLSATERADFFQEYLDQDRIQDVQVAFLPSRSMEVLYYNADWLQELGHESPPRNWEAFAAMCRQAREQPFSRALGNGPSMGLAFDADASRLAAMVFSRGGNLIDQHGSAYTLNTPYMRTSLQMLRDLTAADAATLMSGAYQKRRAFSEGRALFVMRSSSGMSQYRHAVAEGANFTWEMAPVPYELDLPVLNVYGASLAVCTGTPAQQLASWLFVKWFTEPEQQEAWSRRSGYFPVRRSVARDLESFFRLPYGLLDLGQPEPWIIGYGTVREMIGEAMIQAIQGDDIAVILPRLQQQANRSIER